MSSKTKIPVVFACLRQSEQDTFAYCQLIGLLASVWVPVESTPQTPRNAPPLKTMAAAYYNGRLQFFFHVKDKISLLANIL